MSTCAGRFAGVGGFVNISQNAKRVVFCCTFRAGDMEVAVQDGRLRIVREGGAIKFVERVQQVCFHGPSAVARGQRVLYVTERAVFELTAQGLALIEVAPGIDVARDILPGMAFRPMIGAPGVMAGSVLRACEAARKMCGSSELAVSLDGPRSSAFLPISAV